MRYNLHGLTVGKASQLHNAIEMENEIADHLRANGCTYLTIQNHNRFVEINCMGKSKIDDEINKSVCPSAKIRITKRGGDGYFGHPDDAYCLRLRRRMQGKYKIDRGEGIKKGAHAWHGIALMVIEFLNGVTPKHHASTLPTKPRKKKVIGSQYESHLQKQQQIRIDGFRRLDEAPETMG